MPFFHFSYVLSDLESYGCANEISTKAFEPPKNKTMFNILTFKSKIVLRHPWPNITQCIPYFLSFFNDFQAMDVQSEIL